MFTCICIILTIAYFRNISSNLEMSNIKFNDAVKLKNHINNMLIFFYLYWRDIKQVSRTVSVRFCYFAELHV